MRPDRYTRSVTNYVRSYRKKKRGRSRACRVIGSSQRGLPVRRVLVVSFRVLAQVRERLATIRLRAAERLIFACSHWRAIFRVSLGSADIGRAFAGRLVLVTLWLRLRRAEAFGRGSRRCCRGRRRLIQV